MKAVIFDLDGTLTDSIESITYSANEALKHVGYGPFNQEAYKRFVGDGAKTLLERCLKNRGDEKLAHFSELEQEYKKIFKEYCTYKVTPYEGIVSLLEELRRNEIQIAVLSNKPHEQTVKVVESIFGEDCFDMVVGQNSDIAKKPSPDGIYYISEHLNIPISEIIYVGDTDTDMKAGKRAGALTVGVLWGFRNREELQKNEADIIIQYPDELLEYVL